MIFTKGRPLTRLFREYGWSYYDENNIRGAHKSSEGIRKSVEEDKEYTLIAYGLVEWKDQ